MNGPLALCKTNFDIMTRSFAHPYVIKNPVKNSSLPVLNQDINWVLRTKNHFYSIPSTSPLIIDGDVQIYFKISCLNVGFFVAVKLHRYKVEQPDY